MTRIRVRTLAVLLAAMLGVSLAASSAEAAAPTRVRTLPVAVAGAPRTLVTLVVPVPTELERQSRVHYAVAMSGAVDVLGRLEGELNVAAGAKTVMLTLRVPATALVGLLDVADVVFTAPDGSSVEVPIILRVPGIYALRVTGVRELAALERGDRIELEYHVQNLGNDTERLRVQTAAPSDWTVRVESGEDVVVAPYATATVILRLRVPAVQNTGSYTVGVRLARVARRDSVPAGAAMTLLRVKEPVQRAEVLGFHPFVGGAMSADGGAVASGLRIAGPVVEGVRLDASVTPPTNARGLSAFGLNNVGLARLPFTATLAAQDWRVHFGAAQSALPQLTGLAIGGRGGSATVRRGDFEYHVVGAQPVSGRGQSGAFVGVGVRRTTELGRFGVSVASMDQRTVGVAEGRRSLKAVGVDWGSGKLWDGVDVGAGLALRQFHGGAGIGLNVDVSREFKSGRARVSALIAPGGTAAYAPASRRLTADIMQQVGTDWWLDANAQVTEDDGNVFQESRLSGASAGARTQLGDQVGVGARVGIDVSRADGIMGGSGGFLSRQRYLAGSVSAEIGGWSLSADGRTSVAERETRLFSGAEDRRSAPQHSLNTSASRGLGLLGYVSLGSTYVVSGAGLGLPGSALTMQASWNELPLYLGERVVRLSHEARLIRTTLQPSALAVRASASTMIAGLDVTGSFERTPFLTDRRGRPAWMFGLRVSLNSQLLTSDRLLTPGTVFRDANGNGRRDEGEPGVPSIVLTHDRLRVSTDRRGEYRVPQSIRGRLRVDPASIPVGLVVHPRYHADTVERREIPLTPTGTLPVVLSVSMDSDGRVEIVDFDKVDVWLRDADGFEWVGRHVGGDKYTFEHVPAGTYTLRASFLRTGQQLRIDETKVTVLPGTNGELNAPVRGRNIRMITPPSQGRGQIGPRNGGSGRNRQQ